MAEYWSDDIYLLNFVTDYYEHFYILMKAFNVQEYKEIRHGENF